MKITKTRNCDYCHQSYEYQRSTSRFCSSQHRVSFHQYGEKAKTKITNAILDCYDTATDIRQNHALATDDLEKSIGILKRALEALETDYWSAVSGQTSQQGGQVYKECPECHHIMFGWQDDIPNDCPACKAKEPKFITR